MTREKRWEVGAGLTLAATLVVADGGWVARQEHRPPPPQFSDYPVSEVFRGRPVRPAPSVGISPTQLPAAPNFAGHFMVVTWGCGTECQQLDILDAKNGRVYSPPFAPRLGAAYRVDSALLMVDPPDEWRRSYGPDLAQVHDGPPRVEYFRWTGTSLVPVASVEVSRRFP